MEDFMKPVALNQEMVQTLDQYTPARKMRSMA